MLLCVNVGNTNAQFGLYERMEFRGRAQVTAADAAAGRLPPLVRARPIETVALASVAPSRTRAIAEALAAATGARPRIAGEDMPIPLEVRLPEPSKVGVDRLLNALAAHRRTGMQTIVVDAGTAITVDLVSASGAFCGGAIAPGPALLLRALHLGTERLPPVSYARPAFVVGRNTEEAMRSGAFWGSVGIIERLIRQVKAELIGPARVLAAGGCLDALAPHIAAIDAVVPELTLEGLAIAATA